MGRSVCTTSIKLKLKLVLVLVVGGFGFCTTSSSSSTYIVSMYILINTTAVVLVPNTVATIPGIVPNRS
jgi:hypothetical protein